MQVRRSLRLFAQEPPLHLTLRCCRRIGAMKLKPILLAILFVSMIGLAGCVDGPGYYGSYGYPTYGYYNRGLWGYGHDGFYHEGHFDHDRFSGAGFHNGFRIAHGGGFRGGFGGGHFGGGHFGGEGGHR
jgi:hypothetical protein